MPKSSAERSRDYYERNKDKRRAEALDHYRKNKESINNNRRAYWKQYALNNKDNPRYKRKCKNESLKSLYGITIEDFETILKAQRKRCALCRRKFAEDLKPCVDHDHKTGKVRGLLCYSCNTLLGMCNDSIKTLQTAIDYVKKHKKA